MTERNTDNSGAQGVAAGVVGANAAGAQGATNTTAGARANGAVAAANEGASVAAQIEANERARKILEQQQETNNATIEKIAKNNRARQELRGKIDEIVDRQEASGSADSSVAKEKKRSKTAKKLTETTNETPVMAEINLAKKRSALALNFEKNKKIWLGAGAGVLALIVIVAVVVGVKMRENDGCEDGRTSDSVVLNYDLEGYGENPPSSIVAATFTEEVTNKLENDEDYTFDDAVADYEYAYNTSEGEMQIDVLLSYANFVFANTGDPNAATEPLIEVAGWIDDENDILRVYTAIINIYTQVGDIGQANYYRSMMDKAVTSQVLSDEDLKWALEAGE